MTLGDIRNFLILTGSWRDATRVINIRIVEVTVVINIKHISITVVHIVRRERPKIGSSPTNQRQAQIH